LEAPQLYKLNQLVASINLPFAAVVNISNTGSEDAPVSGSFYLLARNIPMYAALVFDTEENSVQLMWATFDFKQCLQSRAVFRYVLVTLPTLVDRPLFVHTQNLCARWWKLMKAFGNNRHALLKSANAIELILYKDPDVKSYEN